MPDCRGVGESRIYSKRAKKSLFAGFVPQSGITDWEHISGSIPETEVSPVNQDTDVVPDIGCANHDYSCASNADFR